MIIKAGEQTAEEMERRARTKNTRQGLVDNDAVLPIFKTDLKKEETIDEGKDNQFKESKIKTENNTTSKPIIKTKKSSTSTTGQKTVVKPKSKVDISTSNKDTTSSHGRHTFDINCSICANPPASKSTSPKPVTSIPTGNKLNSNHLLYRISFLFFNFRNSSSTNCIITK
jgi:hypothetical protein